MRSSLPRVDERTRQNLSLTSWFQRRKGVRRAASTFSDSLAS